MSVLNKLKIVAIAPKTGLSPEQQRRGKMVMKLQEQLKMAEAQLGGTTYERHRWVWELDQNGQKSKVSRPMRTKAWWTVAPTGVIQFGLKYGSAPLEIQKGKTAVEVAKLDELPEVIRALIQAVTDGELDSPIKASADSRGFKRKPKKAA